MRDLGPAAPADPQVGDHSQDDELGLLTLVDVISTGDGFDLTYEVVRHWA